MPLRLSNAFDIGMVPYGDGGLWALLRVIPCERVGLTGDPRLQAFTVRKLSALLIVAFPQAGGDQSL